MEKHDIERAIRALGSLDLTDLETINKAISTASRKKLSLKEANELISSKENGTPMAFTDRGNKFHVGIIKRINQKYVNMFDTTENRHYNVLPDTLRVATAEDIDRAENQGPRVTKRLYTKRRETERHMKTDSKGNIIWGRRKTDIQ